MTQRPWGHSAALRLADHAPIMANRTLAVIRKMFNFALDSAAARIVY